MERERTYMQEARRATEVAGSDEHAAEGYERVALAVVEAIAQDTGAVLLVNVANRSSMPFLDADAVVEVPCVVGSAGAFPLAVGDVPLHARALIEAVKEVERTTIAAALTGSRELVHRALALHPLVRSVETGGRIFAAYLERQPELAEQLS
jgi:6-phospho-beta-glucosidase